MLLCLHEEAAVAIAHGYAKVTGKAMAAAVHSNVGLMHATMAFFNAWCDRMPMVVLGATGPVDATKRRPWIDWIHTARDQGALVRGYTKWDDQPASPARRARSGAARRLDRQHRAARPDLRQSRRGDAGGKACRAGAADRRQAFHAAGRKRGAAGRDCRRRRSAAQRQASGDPGRPHVARSRCLERAYRAGRAAQCARRHRFEGRGRLPDRSSAACRRARHHRAGRRKPATPSAPPTSSSASTGSTSPAPSNMSAMSAPRSCRCRVDHHLHNGWSMDYQGLPPVEVMIACETGRRGAPAARSARPGQAARRAKPQR